MFSVFGRWYKRKFSDPDAAMLLILILISSALLLLWGDMLMPVIVAAVIAYLLDWPVTQLNRVGLGRSPAVGLVLLCFILIMVLLAIGLVPVVTKQSVSLAQELPTIWQNAQSWLLTLPDKYPEYVQFSHIYEMMEGANQRLVDFGEQALSASIGSITSVAALLIYFILVPLMVFFMLKDKQYFTASISRILPKERRLIAQVGN